MVSDLSLGELAPTVFGNTDKIGLESIACQENGVAVPRNGLKDRMLLWDLV